MEDLIRDPLSSGSVVDIYEIIGVLGTGGGGISYAATIQSTGRHVAIKEYFPIGAAIRADDRTSVQPNPSSAAVFDEGLHQFATEARTLAAFRHEAIAPVERFLHANGTAYVVMPFIEGELLSLLFARDRKLDRQRIGSLLPPLISGLAEIHRKGIIHRDIKPGNVIVRPDGRPILIDFGSARSDDVDVRARGASPGYAAPELYDGTIPDGPWTDVYSLGALLYRAVTGSAPDPAPSRIENDTMRGALDSALLEHGAGLLEAIDRALSLEPEDRPQNVAEFAALIQRDATDVFGTDQPKQRMRKLKPAYLALAASVAGLAVISLLLIPNSAQSPATTTITKSNSGPKPKLGTTSRFAWFRDCDDCPSVALRNDGKIAVGRQHISYREFNSFVIATGHHIATGCAIKKSSGVWLIDPKLNWKKASKVGPVRCISLNDAHAYLAWLSRLTGVRYRLPSPQEWAALPIPKLKKKPILLARRPRDLNRVTPSSGTATTRRSPKKAMVIAEWLNNCPPELSANGPKFCLILISTEQGTRRAAQTEAVDSDLRLQDLGFRVVREMEPAK